jgi:hypothetical protein
MPNPDADYLTRAAEFWEGGKPIEAGRLVFENLPSDVRPAWAPRILRLVLEKSGVARDQFLRTLDTADHPRQWANGHRCFDILRGTVLELDEL